MTIDRRSELGQRLDVQSPAELNLSALDEVAGRLIADRMADGVTREEATIKLLNFAGKLMADGVVHLDTNRIYEARPEVRRAVGVARIAAENDGRPITIASALTKMIIAGAPKVESRAGDPAGLREQGTGAGSSNGFGDLFEGFFRK